MVKWLNDAVFYEIYPQSFCDSNGDGTGDFRGICDRLDYISGLGANALWINPCFDSPFKDAGYDVRDYKKAAARYGTNEEMYRLFDEAHARGIHVLLDLVPGHTSEEHEWFKKSGQAQTNEYSGRYVWTDFWIRGIAGHPYVGGECERNGTYMLNFFKCQPALNYGWREPKEAWQMGIDEPDCIATRDAMRDVMRFWLSHGCDGFRVDMASSLVKDDDAEKSGTCEVWRSILSPLRQEFPEMALVAEWSEPVLSICGAGFDMDFYLDHPGNGYNSLLREYETGGEDHSYFLSSGGGDITRFLKEYLPQYEKTAGKGYISLLSCNHDTPRAARTLSPKELGLAWAFLFTMPGVPFLYYGDEIGMRFLEQLPSKEGGYTRTGSRTPMQWSRGKNLGFSDADPSRLYLPVDPAEDAPCVEAQEKDPASLLNLVKKLIRLRHAEPSLQADGSFAVLHAREGDPLFVYRRDNIVLAVNPSGQRRQLSLDGILPARADGQDPEACRILFQIGEGELTRGELALAGGSFLAVRIA